MRNHVYVHILMDMQMPNIDGLKFAKLALQGLLALAVAHVARKVLYRLVLAMYKAGHLIFQRLFDQRCLCNPFSPIRSSGFL